MPVYVIFSSEAIAENDRRRPSAGRCRSTRYETGPSSASRIFSHAEARRARREEDWIFSACSAAPREPLPRACLLKRRSVRRSVRRSAARPGSATPATGAALPTGWAARHSSGRRLIFSHAKARRARREEDWIFSACSAAPREPLYSPSS